MKFFGLTKAEKQKAKQMRSFKASLGYPRKKMGIKAARQRRRKYKAIKINKKDRARVRHAVRVSGS